MAWIRSPLCRALAVLFLLGCSSNSSSSSSGCSGSSAAAVCDIDTTATLCHDMITLECHGGTKPEAKSQCVQALKEGDEVVYCCTNAALPADDDSGGGGGGQV